MGSLQILTGFFHSLISDNANCFFELRKERRIFYATRRSDPSFWPACQAVAYNGISHSPSPPLGEINTDKSGFADLSNTVHPADAMGIKPVL
jgi:hypothetical protein